MLNLCTVQALRSHIALLLLLCLVRTLLPEAWMLALHPHAHTTEEPAHAPAFKRAGKDLISAKHQHCEVEQFYNVAYQAGVPVVAPVPRTGPGYTATPPLPPVQLVAGEQLFARSLRGPPSRA
ncbi:hypothetical protein [Hymenobacter rubidus]|uniref:hypothetical protein n=1 Tax=Hymenobacter rubidus TaxID=1441626 RepID=UPI00191FB70A|nr:hypothetical protein [Hymenobacter rubidus]